MSCLHDLPTCSASCLAYMSCLHVFPASPACMTCLNVLPAYPACMSCLHDLPSCHACMSACMSCFISVAAWTYIRHASYVRLQLLVPNYIAKYVQGTVFEFNGLLTEQRSNENTWNLLYIFTIYTALPPLCVSPTLMTVYCAANSLTRSWTTEKAEC